MGEPVRCWYFLELLCTINCKSTVATVVKALYWVQRPSDGTRCAARGLLRCAQRTLKPMLARARIDHELVRFTLQFLVALTLTISLALPSRQVLEGTAVASR